MGDHERLTVEQFQQTSGLEDWRVLAFGASAWFDASSHAAGAALVRHVAELSGSAVRLPDMDLRGGGVHVRIGAPGSAGFSQADVETAREVSAAARDLGLHPDPSAVQSLLLAVDALDKPSVMSFWRAALGYEQLGEDDLVDPPRRQPMVWFQQQDRPRPLPNRIHVDVARPGALTLPEAEALGGRHSGVYDVTLADAEGNEIDSIPDDDLAEGEETADWRVVFGAMAFYPTGSPATAATLAGAVAGLADDAGLPLLIDLRPTGVTIDSGKDRWEDERFGELARRVQAAARGLGLTADQTPLRFLQIGIAAVDIPTVQGFWRAVLGYEDDPREETTDIYDPRWIGPPLFFQQTSADETDRLAQRNRIHVDLFVPDDRARARIDAALAAGGRIVYGEEAPESWTLADPEGNEVDIAVAVGRAER